MNRKIEWIRLWIIKYFILTLICTLFVWAIGPRGISKNEVIDEVVPPIDSQSIEFYLNFDRPVFIRLYSRYEIANTSSARTNIMLSLHNQKTKTRIIDQQRKFGRLRKHGPTSFGKSVFIHDYGLIGIPKSGQYILRVSQFPDFKIVNDYRLFYVLDSDDRIRRFARYLAWLFLFISIVMQESKSQLLEFRVFYWVVSVLAILSLLFL